MSETCTRCDGTGEIVNCCDDLCVGSGVCIHDSYAVCPECRGRGEFYDDDEVE